MATRTASFRFSIFPAAWNLMALEPTEMRCKGLCRNAPGVQYRKKAGGPQDFFRSASLQGTDTDGVFRGVEEGLALAVSGWFSRNLVFFLES